MDIERLFTGIAVIVDDDVNNELSTINKIKKLIEEKGIPVAVFSEIPQPNIVPSLSSASFIILDWEFSSSLIESGERVIPGGTLAKENQHLLIEFINRLLRDIFIPVFIFTEQSKTEIINNLIEAGLWCKDKPNRIFIKSKDEVDTEEELFSSIAEWLKNMPSVYVLKEWEKTWRDAKDAMFNNFYSYSPNWTTCIWNMLKEDGIDNENAFGSFITRHLINRIQEYSFNEDSLLAHGFTNEDELKKVIQGERFLMYDSQPKQVYTGDLFKKNGDYYLNIRAQCSLECRTDDDNYNPNLYVIKGEKLKKQNIVSGDICITNQKEIVFDSANRYPLEAVIGYCENDNAKLQEINDRFSKFRNKVFFRKGTLLERDNKVIIGCIAGEQAICFDLDIQIMGFESMKDKRIGRVLPPYITRVQQKCATYMIREGVLPLPKELFSSFDI